MDGRLDLWRAAELALTRAGVGDVERTDLCSSAGLEPTVFSAPDPFLAALRDQAGPRAVILDWRLERELSAALFMATRHRHPRLPVIYWTGSLSTALPAMIREDALTVVVEKGDGAVPFERAIAWAMDAGPKPVERTFSRPLSTW